MKDKPSVNRKRQFNHRVGYLDQTLKEVRAQMNLSKKQLKNLTAEMKG